MTKSPETLGSSSSRWDPNTRIGKLYHNIYNRPVLLEALSEWQAIAEEAGTSRASLAYRWVSFNSILTAENGDGIIIGATKVEQLKQTLDALAEGPLEPSIAKRIDNLWERVKDKAAIDNYHL